VITATESAPRNTSAEFPALIPTSRPKAFRQHTARPQFSRPVTGFGIQLAYSCERGTEGHVVDRISTGGGELVRRGCDWKADEVVVPFSSLDWSFWCLHEFRGGRSSWPRGGRDSEQMAISHRSFTIRSGRSCNRAGNFAAGRFEKTSRGPLSAVCLWRIVQNGGAAISRAGGGGASADGAMRGVFLRRMGLHARSSRGKRAAGC